MAIQIESNGFLREFISKSSNDLPSRLNFIKNMKEALIVNNRKNEFIRMTILPLLFLDSYKLLLFRIKNGLATETEIQMYSIYEEINNIKEQVPELYLKREDYMDYSIGSVATFNSIPFLGKTLIMKGLSEYENTRLSSFSEIHSNDITYYDIPITENFIYRYYQEKSNRYSEMGVLFSPLSIITEIAGIIHEDYVNEPIEIDELVSSISEQVYTKMDKLKEVFDTDYSYIDELTNNYHSNPDEFLDYSIYDNSVLEETLALYFKMRELGVIKPKRLVNEKHE